MNRKNVEDIYPLSPLQQGLLFHTLYAPGSGLYVEQWPMLVEGDLDVDAFAGAVQRTVDRHPALRTGLVWENVPQPLQVVYREATLDVERLDWSGVDEAEWRARLDAFLAADRVRGFELARAPLVRVAFMRLEARRHLFVFTFHHTVLDGWSMPLLFGDVDAFYAAAREGRTAQLPPAPRYRDYIGWLQAQDAAADEAFWRAQLDGFSTATPLPLDRGGAAVAEEHAEQRLRIPAADQARLMAFAREQALTVNTLVLGAWALVLARYAGTGDVVFGVTVSGRPAGVPGIERAVGLFINTIPFRVRVPESGTTGAWLAELQQLQADVRQHEHVRLTDVQGWSDVPRDRPLFESAYVFENYPLDPGEDDDPLHFGIIPQPERVNFPLAVAVAPGEELELRLSYDPRRFSDDAARRILDALRALLEQAAEEPDRPLSALSALDAGELRRVTEEWARGPALDAPAEPLHAAFARHAAAAPAAVALVGAEGTLTYGELDARAAGVARRLVDAGVRPDAPVGVLAEHGFGAVAAMLGVMKAGGAYLPLDPALPSARLGWMLQDAGAAAVLVDPRLHDRLPDTALPVLRIESAPNATGVADSPETAETDAGPTIPSGSLAYVLYTSGSTGTPKAVGVSHAAAAAHLASTAARYGLTAADRVLAFAALSFDPSLEQILGPLAVGGSVALRDPRVWSAGELADAVERMGITVVDPPTAYWHGLVDDAPAAERIKRAARLVLVGGEAMRADVAERWSALPGDAVLLNAYGPTEAVITASAAQVAPGVRPAIGTPLPGRVLRVLDGRMQPAPAGVPGELYAGGEALARGYLGRPGLTAAAFVPDPFGAPGTRLYRTGDRARWRMDGELEYLGRADFQVKVRGFRIEPGEVEAVLAALPQVGACAVLAREDRPGDVRLVAYVTPSSADAPPRPAALRDALEVALPAQLVPSAFVVLDRLPLTATGKTDRAALPAPGDDARTEAFVAPATATERLLAGIWAEVLGVQRVGARDSFFALGGHSLLAVQVVTRIRRQMGVDVPLRTLFDVPRLHDLARRLDGGGEDDELDALAAALEGLSDDALHALLAADPAPAES